jgi:hypothetical protein
MDLDCHYNFGGLAGEAVEYWDCWSKDSRLGIAIFVSDSLLIRVAKSGQKILSSPLPPRMVRVDGNTNVSTRAGHVDRAREAAQRATGSPQTQKQSWKLPVASMTSRMGVDAQHCALSLRPRARSQARHL